MIESLARKHGIHAPATSAPVELPPSQILRRDVYTKATRGGQAVRKLVAWATNKHDVDSRFPRFAVLFTDYSHPPARTVDINRTIPHEILTSINTRVPRVYSNRLPDRPLGS